MSAHLATHELLDDARRENRRLVDNLLALAETYEQRAREAAGTYAHTPHAAELREQREEGWALAATEVRALAASVPQQRCDDPDGWRPGQVRHGYDGEDDRPLDRKES